MATPPRPTGRSNGLPSSSLQALPVAKTRKSTGAIPIPTKGSFTSTSNNIHRIPSSNFAPPSTSAPTSALLQPKSSMALIPGKTIRKTVSINSFPQPPRGDNRVSSLPPSPLSRPSSTRKSKTTSTGPSSITPSFLNGSADGKSISSGAGNRTSDGLISVSSPPQSRSSSAQDSYSTSATQYDDDTSRPDPHERRSGKNDGKGNVLVSVRARPDGGNKSDAEWVVDGKKSLVGYRGKEGGDYYYDNVFAIHDENARVYDCIAKRLVRRVMEGYHGTVFAYGMTGTGKTFSMQGTASSPGVIPLAITDIFSYIRETPSREFLLRVSYLEIYNEKIHDLLNMSATSTGGQQEEIKLREDPKRGIYASPLKEEIVQSPTQLLRVIARGDQTRRTASTQYNARSSRSHAVVQIVVESRERISSDGTGGKRTGILPGGVRVSTLSLIDLAGSEKAAESRERRQEGSHINKSLLTLGTVISKLSEYKEKEGKSGDSTKHLPYRDSKLTRLLQGALSGNSLVSILCTISCCSAGSTATANTHATETLNTLKFAARAKNSIVSHAKKAEEALGVGGDGGARVLLERYRMEIQELRAQLQIQAKDKNNQLAVEENQKNEEKAREKEAETRHEEQMLEMQLARTALKERIEHLNRLILCSKSSGVNTGSYSSLGMHSRFSQMSQLSSRTSILSSGARPLLERTSSLTSSSTVGRRSSGGQGVQDGQLLSRSCGDLSSVEDEDSVGEYGDGTASLAAQNRALQADLVDKNRYISTLEKRLVQARRASHSRTSVGFSSSTKAIMVGEDHSIAAVIKEKDIEIAELRARLDDKDRMLAALRSAARSRDTAEGTHEGYHEARVSQILESVNSMTPLSATSQSAECLGIHKSGKNVDEMSRILDEMIQDRVESGQLVRGMRGSVRLASTNAKLEDLPEPPRELPPLSPTTDDGKQLLEEKDP